jgi:kynureninase
VTGLDIAEEQYALDLDARDPLGGFRERFFVPDGVTYLDGNSLGLLSIDAERAVLDALQAWKVHGIAGWTETDADWFTLGERLGERMAHLVGASPGSVVVTGSTTVNLHQMAGSFYRPEGNRRKILATSLDFPSDIYALQGQIRLHGGDPAQDIVLAPSANGRTIAEEDLISAMTDEVALALLPSVLYRSGQLLDMERLTQAAHEAGIVIGWDCAHSVGALPHAFDEWNVDFAVWCGYKYLNAGPGATGALYVNPRHGDVMPALPGWWGYHKERQFEMVHNWEGAAGAGAFQISTVPLLSTAALLGSLATFEEAGIEAIRAKSLAQTDYMMSLMDASGLMGAPYGYRIGTPRDPDRRGGHVAIEHDDAARISVALRNRGMIVDFRKPDVVRLAPIALYTTYRELWQVVQVLREIIDGGELAAIDPSSPVT